MKAVKLIMILMGIIIVILLSSLLDSHTKIILGLACDFVGGILLASEMIGLLEKIENRTSALQKRIHLEESKILPVGLRVVIIYALKRIFNIKTTELPLKSILALYKWRISFVISYGSLSFLEYLANIISTKRGIGLMGTIFLCFGFVFQIIGNL
jgi:hypothetical protein